LIEERQNACPSGRRVKCKSQKVNGIMSVRMTILYTVPFLWCCSSVDNTETTETTEQLSSLTGKHILIVYGGWEGHHPKACTEIYVPWLTSLGAQVTTSDTLGIYADSTFLSSVDLIIQTWTLGEITDDQLNGLLAAVRNGTGFAGWHGGIVDAFRGETAYHLMTGGQFLAHPGDIIRHTIDITAPDDPIVRGIEDFEITTEQYYVMVNPNVEVLATTTFNGAHLPWIEGHKMPVIWKHHYGKGRVYVNTIGHRIEDHSVLEFVTTLRRGFDWACR
jgi:type 1 glutamine amidotransferase